MPGTTVERVALQRAAEGHPLDDVVVYALDALGNPATLEVQVKKGITFAPSDSVFREVVGQIAEASHKPEYWTTRYELGIADVTHLAQYRRPIPGALATGPGFTSLQRARRYAFNVNNDVLPPSAASKTMRARSTFLSGRERARDSDLSPFGMMVTSTSLRKRKA
jgi:hypothetical protein